MSPRQALARLFEGVRADTADYGVLRDLLEQQFAAALAHRSEEITALVERILEVTATLRARSKERTQLAALILGGKRNSVTMRDISARLPANARKTFDTAWQRLESLVRECKRLNARNAHLLMTQRDIMQRVLGTESDTYAPA
ncbi:MAG: flagellar export chaperone FlgN [Steroidobacteraceae bacterium]|nr:flagellar export chaperone FlgN [Steroidobacteraceae bacterium]